MRVAIFLLGLSLATAVKGAETTSEVKVAAIQCSSIMGDVAANRQKLMLLIEEAATNGAKIVVLPEAAITGYLSQDVHTNWHLRGWPMESTFTGRDPLPCAETVPGPSTQQFGALAKRLRIYLTVPFVEIDRQFDPPHLYNTACLVAPSGDLVAHYRKLTPWPFPEKSWATPGDRGVQYYDTEYGRVGLAICYDIYAILEKYQPYHIWALLYPIAWVDNREPSDWFGHRLPQRIARFHHYLIGANWSVDKDQPWLGYGYSTIISPNGEVLASAKTLHGSEIVYAIIPTASRRRPSRCDLPVGTGEPESRESPPYQHEPGDGLEDLVLDVNLLL